MSITGQTGPGTAPVNLEALTQQLAYQRSDQQRPLWRSPMAIRIAIIAAILGSWELSAAMEWVDPLFTSRPTAVAEAIWNILPTSQLHRDVGYTLAEVGAGYAIGVTLGVLVGFVLGTSRLLREALQPVLNALNSVPRIALVPLFVAWFGLGMMPRIVMAVTVVFFVMVTAVVAALSQPDRDSGLLARSLGASRRDMLFKFQLPRAVPVIVSGLELSLIYAFLGVIAAEIVSGSNGLGARMTEYANLFQAANFFAVLAVLTVITTLLAAGIRRVERRLLRWHEFETR
jgi:NitT/TauT family transport system permease protein